MAADMERMKRWRLVLGRDAQDGLARAAGGALALSRDEQLMDEALAAIYDNTEGFVAGGASRKGGHEASSPVVSRWLGDIRTFFREDVVAVLQRDAIERKGLKRLLFEPEVLKSVQPDLNLAVTILSLRGQIPERTRETARQLVRAVVGDIDRRLGEGLRRAVAGALNRRSHSPMPDAAAVDWKLTIRRNLKHFNPELGSVVPEKFWFFDRARRRHDRTVIVDIDQSGSMGESIIYSSVMGCILSGISALSTRVVSFDTSVVDLTEQYGGDPVDMLFGIQLGGGTDINKSVAYCREFMPEPRKTLFMLVSDLFEGGNEAALVRQMAEMKESGVAIACLLALSDAGAPAYNEALAQKLSKLGIPCFACTPGLLPGLLEAALKGRDLKEFIQNNKS
jgi:hypothetical protein